MTAAATLAAPQLTEIHDVLYKANGTLFEGVAQIEWKAFVASDGTPVPPNTVNVRIVRGQLRVSLVPTTDANTVISYTARFNSEGKTQFVEYWSVPPTRNVLKLRDIRVPAPNSAGNLTSSVSIQDVSGLRTELDLRPPRGAGWSNNRAAVIGPSGSLEAVSGADADCVRVDGTSGPCGSGVVFVDGDTPLGVKNGSNRNFTLSAPPYPAQSLRVYRNGLLLAPADFTVAGSVVTVAVSATPVSTDVLQVWYRISGPSPSIVEGEVPSGTLNGVNLSFSLAGAPIPASSLQLHRNGMLQKQGIDYYMTASAITFFPLSVPQSGDLLLASYRK
ncbi:MAG: hypothetical protein SGI92_32160 [Bryobacteraceae bacterium]|nr:hypothetical protein [Bryobacteraceae bacterium]